jgi:hypothetical protein
VPFGRKKIPNLAFRTEKIFEKKLAKSRRKLKHAETSVESKKVKKIFLVGEK